MSLQGLEDFKGLRGFRVEGFRVWGLGCRDLRV